MLSNRNWMRVAFALGGLAAAGLLGYGYYLQYFQGQDPCPLCLVQRVFYLAFFFTSLLATLHGPLGGWAIAYGGVAALFAAGGFGTAARQVYLQHLPPDKVPACGPDLYFMLDNFPLTRVFDKLFTGSGQCAEVHWRFLGLSIAEWSLVCFAGLVAYAIWLAVRGYRLRGGSPRLSYAPAK